MFGEPKLICASLVMTGASLVLLPLIHGDGPLRWSAVLHLRGQIVDRHARRARAAFTRLQPVARAGCLVCFPTSRPPTSRARPSAWRKAPAALARIVGPMFAASLYGLNDSTRALPYLICGSIAILPDC
jgi:hypothetical protein